MTDPARPQVGRLSDVNRGVMLLIGLASAVIAVAGVRSASSMIGSIMLAVVLTVAVLPVGRWAMRRGWPSWACVGLTLMAAYAVLLGLIGSLALAVAQLAATVPHYSDRVSAISTEIIDRLSEWGVDTSSAKTALTKVDLGKVVSLLTSLLSSVLTTLGTLAFIGVLLFFLTADSLGLLRRAAALREAKPEAARVLADFAYGTQRYLLVSTVFGLIVAVLDAGALWLLGIPLAVTWGLLSFVTNFIPNVGFVLGVIPPAALALLDRGWQGMLAVLVVYSVLNVVIQTFIQPRFVGDSVGLNATTTFLALTFWGFVLGPLGALLAVPATIMVRAVWIDPNPDARWVMLLVGSSGPEADEVDDDPSEGGRTGGGGSRRRRWLPRRLARANDPSGLPPV